MNVSDIVTYKNGRTAYFLVLSTTKEYSLVSRCNKKGELTGDITHEIETEWLEEIMEVVPEKAIDFSEVV